ncbi:YitT family protein [Paenibacillus durus]|uniref:YitT family protein n=1 Tax=Paenibacillus durus TaxID=44251 RepID=UPI0009DDE6F8|nr:YitT family protein [Paenibacillus durus]
MHTRHHAVVNTFESLAKTAREAAIVVLSALLVAAGLKLFLIPHQLLSGGVAGTASVIGYLTNPKYISLIYFGINLPILLWGFVAVGKKYICLSMLCVASTTWFLTIIPQVQVTKDPILASIFGGVIIAGGIGFSLRAGGSSGGFDILGSIITRKRDVPMGTVLFIMDGVIILTLGFMKSWDSALYAMLCTFVKSKVVDIIHIRHVKLTCFIVTKRKDEMVAELNRLPHGVTVVNAEGGYSHEGNTMLMTVTTRYELAELRKVVVTVDPTAFVNVLETVEILGRFKRLA